MTNDIMIVVAAALIDATGRILVQQRPLAKAHGGLWEFPGGKVEPAERPEAAIARELSEELGIQVEMGALEPVSFVAGGEPDRPLLLLLYACDRWVGQPAALDAVALHWDIPEALAALPMPPADYPLAAALARWLVVEPSRKRR
ncbi:(deoxy)nucleoside triphosphate pyrophosphohydrolase [Sphingomonas sp. S-NIH.Pt15_0812]|uniref:(deoxy)nucleoside triphosphate pyrophosphohydrolase n=1 Tax=Sphingomonas sp. S-NIH.Pt15_0812 TaxID=1920129 RepID=UPI001F495F37|nr:(deoxy)nucleoside triphosphate pyrophosphohydrolase [Sphingomonas sp. S-NIH.Pt15_0812]